MNERAPQSPCFSYGVKERNNRGTHGDSSFMLDGLPSSSEKPLPLGMGYVTRRVEENQQSLEEIFFPRLTSYTSNGSDRDTGRPKGEEDGKQNCQSPHG